MLPYGLDLSIETNPFIYGSDGPYILAYKSSVIHYTLTYLFLNFTIVLAAPKISHSR